MWDVQAIRREFPILHRLVGGRRLVYLDGAATSQKPRAVIEAIRQYYEHSNANVHRGIHRLAEEATHAFEEARSVIAAFLGAADPRSLVFVRNATEAINLVAHAWGDRHLRPGEEIVVSEMEHHSNLVPWQMLAQRTGAQVDYLGIDGEGRLVLDDLDRLLTERTKIVAITHQSNVLGTVNPVEQIAERAHAVGAVVLVDGAQSVPHMPVNVQGLGVDFLAFSGHKLCAPTGIGVLWGRRRLLEAMPPFLGGGSMIKLVELDQITYADVPARFEAGTPAIGEAIALGEAADFLSEVGLDTIHRHEQELLGYLLGRLGEVEGLTIHGPLTTESRGAAVSFSLEGIHPHDIAAVLDSEGVAVRAGHHCAQPLHRLLDVPATTRASLYLYNIPEEIDRLVSGLDKAKRMFG